jgi:nucleoside-triphosphatase THEP1
MNYNGNFRHQIADNIVIKEIIESRDSFKDFREAVWHLVKPDPPLLTSLHHGARHSIYDNVV